MGEIEEDDTAWDDMVRTVTNVSNGVIGDRSSANAVSELDTFRTISQSPATEMIPLDTIVSMQSIDGQCRGTDYVQCVVCKKDFDPGNEAGRYDCWYQIGTVDDTYSILIPAGHVPAGHDPLVYLMGTATLSVKALSYIKSQDPKRYTRLSQNTFTAKYSDGGAKQVNGTSLTVDLLHYYRYCIVTQQAITEALRNLVHAPEWRNVSSTRRHTPQLLMKVLAKTASNFWFTSLNSELWVWPMTQPGTNPHPRQNA